MSLCTYCHALLAPGTQAGFDLSPLFTGVARMEAPTGRREAPPDDRLRAVIRDRLFPHYAPLHAGYRPCAVRYSAASGSVGTSQPVAQQRPGCLETRRPSAATPRSSRVSTSSTFSITG